MTYSSNSLCYQALKKDFAGHAGEWSSPLQLIPVTLIRKNQKVFSY